MDQKLIAIKCDQVLNHSSRIDVVPEDFIDLGHAETFEELHD